MNYLVFYALAAAQLWLSLSLFKATSPLSMTGASEYEKLRRHRIIAVVLLVTCALTVFFGILTQLEVSGAMDGWMVEWL